MNNEETLLRVEHLKQYFRDGNKYFKAVSDISFDIKKGEVFGLVGESGCGKTTTGRSIIKLYNPTGGNVYFNGERISAGLRDYKKKIAQYKLEMKTADTARKAELKALIKEEYKALDEAIADNKKHRTVTDIQMIFQDPIASLNPRMTVREIIAEGLRIRGIRDNKVIAVPFAEAAAAEKRFDERLYNIAHVLSL